jgi:hypothetical protein
LIVWLAWNDPEPVDSVRGAAGGSAESTGPTDMAEPPPLPQIRPVHNPSSAPKGQHVSPDGPHGQYELPGPPGHFSYEGVSFRYPRSWELVRTNGYHGLVGNNLWLAPIGVDNVDYVLVMANYFPWEYSTQQMQTEAEAVVENHVSAQGGRLLRPATPVRTGGVTVFWSDTTGREVSGVEVVSRIYVFAWNDVEYFFNCQEAVGSPNRIIRGCDRIFSTLRLGMPNASP